MPWILEAELPGYEALRAALMEPVNPIVVQDCSWCEKDEAWVPLHECLSCQHNRQDAESTWCCWAKEKAAC